MIVARNGLYLTKTGHDHEQPRRGGPEFARHRDIWTRCLTSKKLVDMVGGVSDVGGRGGGRADLDRSQYGMPTLMRSARGVYAQAIRAQLQLIGIDELPANGAFILEGIDASGGPRHDLPAELGVTKQAVNQVIDILVNRGYLTRNPDSGDRRRVVLELTDRGQEAVDAVRCGIEAVDRLLAERVSRSSSGRFGRWIARGCAWVGGGLMTVASAGALAPAAALLIAGTEAGAQAHKHSR